MCEVFDLAKARVHFLAAGEYVDSIYVNEVQPADPQKDKAWASNWCRAQLNRPRIHLNDALFGWRLLASWPACKDRYVGQLGS